MGKELYPPEGVSFCDWLCDLMCGDPEWEDEDDEESENADQPGMDEQKSTDPGQESKK